MAAGIIIAALAAAAAFVLRAGYFRPSTMAPPELVLANPAPPAAFPLKIEPGKRHLVDSQGTPFLIRGDAAWSLIADLTREEAEIYLMDRRARGFNTILVNLIEHKFARKAPANIYGDTPFTEPGNFATPNDAYFSHADWVLKRAREMGFLVLLAPAYTGWIGGNEGWWEDMVRNGRDRLHAYGRFVGERYRHFDHIIWVNGGDDDPHDKALVEAVAEGLKEAAPEQLHTSHNRGDTLPAVFWQGAKWLDIVTAYSWKPVCDYVAAAYEDPLQRPVFLIESIYENEHEGTPRRMRVQAYQALLCGASGQVYGNNPVWHFRHPGLFPAPADWWASLGSQGAVSMTRLADVFLALPWWKLEPDLRDQLIVDGARKGLDRAVAAKAADGSFALAYVPTQRTIEVDVSQLSGGTATARWIDPVSGASLPSAETAAGARGPRLRLTAPGSNSGGDGDWVLILTPPV